MCVSILFSNQTVEKFSCQEKSSMYIHTTINFSLDVIIEFCSFNEEMGL